LFCFVYVLVPIDIASAASRGQQAAGSRVSGSLLIADWAAGRVLSSTGRHRRDK